MNEKVNFMNWDNIGSALITGASSGIGAEFALQLAQQGFSLILVARRKEKLEALSRDLSSKFSVKVEVLVADLSNLEDIERVASKILNTDNLDILINNAGYGINTPFIERENKQNIDMINVHFTSPVMLSHAAIQGMAKRKKGVIINTASLAAITKTSGMYSSTKAALTYFSETLRSELRHTGIFIQALCPGMTYTEFHDKELMRGFNREDYSSVPWMNAEEVVLQSLKSVNGKTVIFIPGEENRNLMKGVRKSTMKKYLNCKIL